MNVIQYLQDQKAKLLNTSNWKKIAFSKEWLFEVPESAGVYVLKRKKEIVYVGETGNLRKRMKELSETRHHILRRTIGHTFFSDQKGYEVATNRKKFPLHIEDLVNKYICDNLLIAIMEVPLGRKELEELIESEMTKENRLNKRGKRK